MSEKPKAKGLSRREFIKAGTLVAGAAALTPRLAIAQTPRPKSVRRNRTLALTFIAREGRWADYDLWNPYAVGANHQSGSGILYEPLAYYSAFADKEYLWLAESYKYTPDFKELTIKTRSGITWSDGTAFSAEDVAYTLNTLRELGPKIRWGVDVQQFVQEVRATDANTVLVKFKVPSPRFSSFMTYKYDIGVYIVPKHIFQGQDWNTFKHFDIAKGWPVTTSAWKVVFSSPEQKILDRRDEWWAAKAGLAPMPKVERNVWLPWAGEQQAIQALIANELDMGWTMQPTSFPTMFQQNPKLTTFVGQKLPYGYMDWWPYSLYVNNERPPFNDRDIRWALSYFIDRQQIVQVSFSGAAEASALPMPYYPALRPYYDSVKDLLQKSNTLEFNPTKGAELLTKKGWKKDSAGFWADAQGNRFKLDVIGFASLASIGPVLAEQLKRQGIDASFAMPPDFNERFSKGQFNGALYGHGGGVNDPYYTLRLYQSATEAVPGAHLVNFSRWKNEAYDKIVDDMYVTDMNNKPKLRDLFQKAMEIWIPELPDIQLTYNYHRIPTNNTYWTNYPTEQNPYVTSAPFHLTFAMVLWSLRPTQ